MSDFSINQYGEKSDKDNKNAEDPFSGFLTKAQHRNPEIHVLGDNLPQEILAYQAGSATLQPDVAGNTPVLLRSFNEVIGVGGTLVLTAAVTPVPGLTLAVTCPLQASGFPFVLVSYNFSMFSVPTGGGAAGIFSQTGLYSNAVLINGSTMYYERDYLAANSSHQPIVIANKKVPIAPGQTITIDIRSSQPTPAGFSIQYTAQALADRSVISAGLYY